MEEDLFWPHVLDGLIRDIKFNLATTEEISTSSISDCSITHPNQLTNPFLGLPVESGKCESCGAAELGKCEGHFGYIQLPIPIYHPWHISELRQVLSAVCLKCLRVKKGKVKQSAGKGKSSTTTCFHCRDVPPMSVKEIMTSEGAVFLELKVPSRARLRDGFWNFLGKYGFRHGDGARRLLLPCEALQILRGIPEDTKKRLAGRGYFPQNGFILECLPVPPNCLYVPDTSDQISIMSSDISLSMLKRVLNKVEVIKRSRSGAPNFESHEVEANDLQPAIAQYMQLRGSTKSPKDVMGRYGFAKDASKSSTRVWLDKIKTLFISKGSGFSSRAVITGDSYKGIDEIGLPLEIAQKITFEERVTVHNMKRLQELVDKRLCITYRDGLSTYAISVGSKGHTYLKIGQIVNRRVMDGDIVFLNRPPSTHKHSLQAFQVYIHDDHTVKINPLICSPLSADFDGDCIHLFYPQSLAARAEALELFHVEQQLLCSHNGSLNIQLASDSLLSLKLMFKTPFLNKTTAQQLAMYVSHTLPRPALLKNRHSGPCWTILQIIQSALPQNLDCSGDRHLICDSNILRLDSSRDMVQSSFAEVISSIFFKKGSKEALKFINILQPLLMEVLFMDGCSISLKDFDVPKTAVEEVKKNFEGISPVLGHLNSTYDEHVQIQVENYLKDIRLPIVSFIMQQSELGNLVDFKSDSAILKLVQQLGFLGLQLFDRGRLYTRVLVEDMSSDIKRKYFVRGVDHPFEAFGLIKSSFLHGLNPCEALVHSISSREGIVRSSRGLTEPGVLFKNLMAILRDVVICYDGTVRNICSNIIIQFNYGKDDDMNALPAGEPVGVLAATAISNPAYKAVLDSSPSNSSSWDLMKEILLCKVIFKNDLVARRVILYLNDCYCGRKYCKENAAYSVLNCLKRVTLKDIAVDFAIEYRKELNLSEGSEFTSGLVGHIHLDKVKLNGLNRNMDEIHKACQAVLDSYAKKKKNQFSQFFRRLFLASSECCCFHHAYGEELSQWPCLQFYYYDPSGELHGDSLEGILKIMVNTVGPILLDTIAKGDSRVYSANIIWISSDSPTWVRRNLSTAVKGDLALEVIIDKDEVKRSGDAWRTALDCCLPVLHLIDTSRSIPYGIQQIQDLLGISCSFDQSIQRLSSIKTIMKGVLKEHLILVANSMTCTGNLIGFNASGYRALFRSMKVQVPFTEATLSTPMKCFERAAEKCHVDSLSSAVASCSWGKHVSIGTGASFQIMWSQKQMTPIRDAGKNVYEFLQLVNTGSNQKDLRSSCLGVDVDNLGDMENMDPSLSPEHDTDFDKPTFDDSADFGLHINGRTPNGNETNGNSNWDNFAGTPDKSDWQEWGNGKKHIEAKYSALSHTSPGNHDDGWTGWGGEPQFDTGRIAHLKSSDKIDESDGWNKGKQPNVDDDNVHKKSSVWSSWDAKLQGGDCRPMFGKVDEPEQSPVPDANSSWNKLKPSNDASDGWNKEKQPNVDDDNVHKKSSVWSSWDAKLQGGDCRPTFGKVDEPEQSPVPDANSSWNKLKPSNDASDGWNKEKQPNVDDADMQLKSSDWSSWDSKLQGRDCQPTFGQVDCEVQSRSDVWDGQSSEKDKRSSNWGKWNLNKGQSQVKQQMRSSDRGSNAADQGNLKNNSLPLCSDNQKNWNTKGIHTATGKRLDSFTCEEENVLDDVDKTMHSMKRILHQSSDGDQLSLEDQSFIMDNVFDFHPDKNSKVNGRINYIMVNKHNEFQDSRCFYVVSEDGSSADFSYHKCMENYVKQKYPEVAESFIGKYFRKRRTEAALSASTEDGVEQR
ncbi:DNA-directed RNA polymerase E subunit 1 [Acorus calamus]|uniref:DNA-directed RNA polymerase subunit n=1 Tax=Acorus calamus TaxID=4465 RepID=A0AAV9E6M7_ACOCL|nr:DNA-directed RNA polymerase E subunit 1 [Acorus calamus]